MQSVYLDYNATAPVHPAAADAMIDALRTVGNPSSVHAFGRRARARVEDAREAVATLIGASSDSLLFTSGGTESVALALRGLPGGRRFVSAVEHACVLSAAGPDAGLLPVDGQGRLDLAALEADLAAAGEAPVVAVQLANNETGVLQPVAEAARLVHAVGGILICDAVQGPGKVAVDMRELGVDAMALSAHKMGGPQGVGALVLRPGLSPAPLIGGGGQERGLRGGTLNVPGISGFGAAARAVQAAGVAPGMGALRDALEAKILGHVPGAVIFSRDADRLPNTTCVALAGLEQQRQIMALDLSGIAVSAGSACSSGKIEPSHVLRAMGVDAALARCAIRISLGQGTTLDEIECFLTAWVPMAKQVLTAA